MIEDGNTVNNISDNTQVPTDNTNSVSNEITSQPTVNPDGTSLTAPTMTSNVSDTSPSGVPTDTSNKVSNQIPQNPQNQQLTTVNHPSVPPQVQQAHRGAHVVNGIMDVLGLAKPEYKTVINPDGSSSQVQMPRRGKDVGMAIALAALTGAFSGLGERGPGATGRAAAQGFAAGSQMRQKAQDSLDQQSSADFLRKQQTLEYNMRLRNLAMDVGMKDKAVHDQFVDSSSHMVDYLESLPNSGDIIKYGTKDNPLTEDEADDIKKHSPFDLMRIPVSTMGRTRNGENVYLDPMGRVSSSDATGAYQAWDNGYILVDKNAKMHLSDENGPIPELKELINRSGDILGIPKTLLAGEGSKTDILASTYGNWLLKDGQMTSMQHSMDQLTSAINGDKTKNDSGYTNLDVRDGIRNKKINFKDVENFGKVFGGTSQGNTTPLNAKLDSIAKTDPNSASRLENWIGLENIHKYKTSILNQDAADKKAAELAAGNMNENEAGSIISKAASGQKVDPKLLSQANEFQQNSLNQNAKKVRQDEEIKNQVEAEYQQAQQQYLTMPSNWTKQNVDEVSQMPDSFEARKYLESHGVKVPSNFGQIWNVAHDHGQEMNQAFPNRVSKGTGQMDVQNAGSYIHQFVNPNFQNSDYAAGKEFNKDVNDPSKSPTIAAGVAVRHLDMLVKASKELGNTGVLGNSPIANEIRQIYHVQTGDPAPKVFNAILDKVNQEVSKVAAGRAELKAEMEKTDKNLDWSQPEKTIDAVMNSYIGLMNGRLQELNETSRNLFNRDVRVSPEVTNLFRSRGFQTPWGKGIVDVPKGKIAARDRSGNIVGYADDTKGTNYVPFK